MSFKLLDLGISDFDLNFMFSYLDSFKHQFVVIRSFKCAYVKRIRNRNLKVQLVFYFLIISLDSLGAAHILVVLSSSVKTRT